MADKNLAVFLDGTWNSPESKTNVWHAYDFLRKQEWTGNYEAYYGEGVGTKFWERISGGAFAKGLSSDVCNAYAWLVEHYKPGDNIFLFGFSRGAFTARSLAGMIARCGLIEKNTSITVEEAYDRYDSPKEHTPLHELVFRKDREENVDFTREEMRFLTYSRRVEIAFLGLWDTVGTVGVPVGNIRGFSRRQFTYHHTRWSTLYKNFAHALAVDERRKDYLPVMLYDYIPDNEKFEQTQENLNRLALSVEQRWFPGVHASVGGGYSDNTLAMRPLQWILEKAKDAGLPISTDKQLGNDHGTGALVDSYDSFLNGIYKHLPWTKPVNRTIGAISKKVTGGSIVTINESIDRSVFLRWQNDETYRPENVQRYLSEMSLNPLTIHNDLTIERK